MGFVIPIADFERGARTAEVELCSSGTVKRALALDGDYDDPLLAVYCDSAKRWIETNIHRPLDDYSWTIAFPTGKHDTDEIQLVLAPVDTVLTPSGQAIAARTRDGFQKYIYWSDVKDTDAVTDSGVVNLHITTQWTDAHKELILHPYLTLIAEMYRNREARVRRADISKVVIQALWGVTRRSAIVNTPYQASPGIAAQSPTPAPPAARVPYPTIEIIYGWGTAQDGITGQRHEATILAGVPDGIATDLVYPIRDVAVRNSRGRTGGYFNIFLPAGWELYRDRIWGDSEVGQRRVGMSQWWSRFSSANIAGTIFKVVAVKTGERPSA